MGLGPVPLGGSGGRLLADGGRWWKKAEGDSGAGGELNRSGKAKGKAHDGDLLPSRFNHFDRRRSGSPQPPSLEEAKGTGNDREDRAHASRVDLGDG